MGLAAALESGESGRVDEDDVVVVAPVGGGDEDHDVGASATVPEPLRATGRKPGGLQSPGFVRA
jgi:hypothetical protein